MWYLNDMIFDQGNTESGLEKGANYHKVNNNKHSDIPESKTKKAKFYFNTVYI